jgi:hypothetical protein
MSRNIPYGANTTLRLLLASVAPLTCSTLHLPGMGYGNSVANYAASQVKLFDRFIHEKSVGTSAHVQWFLDDLSSIGASSARLAVHGSSSDPAIPLSVQW